MHQHQTHFRKVLHERKKTDKITLYGCFTASKNVNRDVSRIKDGLPSRFSTYRAATPVPNLAE